MGVWGQWRRKRIRDILFGDGGENWSPSSCVVGMSPVPPSKVLFGNKDRGVIELQILHGEDEIQSWGRDRTRMQRWPTGGIGTAWAMVCFGQTGHSWTERQRGQAWALPCLLLWAQLRLRSLCCTRSKLPE